MDEFEKIRAFSAELGKKAEEAVVAENEALKNTEVKENNSEVSIDSERVDFLENWTNEKETPEENRKITKTFWIVLVGVSLLAVCLIVVLYLLFKTPMENEELVMIAPTQKPVKVRPENPGGMVIPDQDKVIYSRLTQDTIPAKVEKLFPEEEKPVMPVVTEESSIASENQESEVEEIKIIQSFEPLQEETTSEKELLVSEKKVEVKKTEKVDSKKLVTSNKETLKGEWKVQLFSSTDKAKVEKQWQRISKKYKALVSDMPMQIVPAEIPGKGTFYRLKIGAFETREMANNLCVKLKKQKQDCIPAK